MQEVGLAEAEAHLSEIADRVRQAGPAVTLTKLGVPYVDLVPNQPAAADPARRSKAEFADLAELRRGLPKVTAVENRAAIAEGRR